MYPAAFLNSLSESSLFTGTPNQSITFELDKIYEIDNRKLDRKRKKEKEDLTTIRESVKNIEMHSSSSESSGSSSSKEKKKENSIIKKRNR